MTSKNKQSVSCELIGHKTAIHTDTTSKVAVDKAKKTLRTGSVASDLL